MNIQLPTGLTVNVSVYEYIFLLEDDDMDLFYQQCIAENLGTYVENPFSSRTGYDKLQLDKEDDIEEID